jgi:hypothetical protein
MAKFRKKPVVIEAIKVSEILKILNESHCGLQEIWIQENVDKGIIVFGSNYILVKTSEGLMKADIDDYIIQGIQGEIYPCKPDIFEKTYEPVE